MKRNLFVYIFLAPMILLKAQTISVTEFYMDPTDLTANTAGTIVLDQNGYKSALIKIETTHTGFSFDTGGGSIIKTEQKVGEIWIYVPEGVKRLSVSHPKLGILHNYDLGQTLKRARTYIMRLNTGDSFPSGQSPNTQYVTFNVFPQSAIVIIDGDTVITKNGTAEIMKRFGTYDYRVEAHKYKAEAGKVTVNEQSRNNIINVKLKSELGVEGQPILTFNVGETSFSMVLVEGGTFQMGGDSNSDPDSRGRHDVTLSPFYIGETEVTNQLWKAVMGKRSAFNYEKENLPVTAVSWEDCQEFLIELNNKTGCSFRLPTEAEWEFAARGGVKSCGFKYCGSNILGAVGWYDNNSSKHLHRPNEVKTKKGNELGIYDMSGNVWEWCSDWFGNYPTNPQIDPLGPNTGTERVMRGGSIMDGMKHCGVAFRSAKETCRDPKHRSSFIGFRIALNY